MVTKKDTILSIIFDGIPKSWNRLYRFNSKTKRMYLDPIAKQYKQYIYLRTPTCPFLNPKKLVVGIVFYGNWFTKLGKPRKIDLQNLDKLLVDAIFKKLGLDDSLIFELVLRKVQSTQELTHVEIAELGEGGNSL